MSARDRKITLDDLAEPVEDAHQEDSYDDYVSSLDEELSVEDMKVGIAGCWLHPTRVCDPTCMAFNHHKLEDGEHPCLVLVSLQSVADPVAEAAHERTEEMKKVRRSVDTLSQTVSQLVSAMQQAASRIR